MLKRREEIWRLSSDEWLSVSIDQVVDKSKTCMVLLHGLSGDKIGPQGLLSNLSKYICENCNIKVVRFDFRGSGLSSSKFIKTSLHSMCEDALFVANNISETIIWSGISTGALIAIMAAAKRGENETMLAISNGFAEKVEFNDLGITPVPIRGGQLFLEKQYFDDRAKLFPRKSYFSKLLNKKVVLGSGDLKHYSEIESLKNFNIDIHVIDGADHLFSSLKHRLDLFRKVRQWIDEEK